MERMFKQIALERLLSSPSREFLLDWINWLDLEAAMASSYSMTTELGVGVVMQSIARELIPWLQGEVDPVALRVRHDSA